MAEGKSAAVGIEAGGVERGLLQDGEGLRGEGFIELDDGDVGEREAGELESLGNSEYRADAEFLGGAAGGGVGDEARERVDADGLGAGFAHGHGGSGGVARGRAVARGVPGRWLETGGVVGEVCGW